MVTEYNGVNLTNLSIEESITRPLMPFEEFGSLNTILFDERKNRVDHAKLFERIAGSNSYSYVPKVQREYVPTYFNARVTIKKKIKDNSPHNISTACADVELAKKLIAIFGDAKKRNVGYKNISVNNDDTSHMSMIDKSLVDTDILFMRSSDGYHFKGSQQEIDFEGLFEENVNTWLGVDSFEGLLSKTSNSFEFRPSQNLAAKNVITKDITEMFDTHHDFGGLKSKGLTLRSYSQDRYQPILLLEKVDKSFIIVSANSTLDVMHENITLLYAAMQYVHYNGYRSFNINNSWISYYPIDYVPYSHKKFNRSHQPISINEHLIDNRLYISRDEYDIHEVSCSDSAVNYEGTDAYGAMSFKKIIKQTNDINDPRYVSFFSPNNTIVYYEPDVYRVETRIEADLKQDEDKAWRIEISPIQSTDHNINITTSTIFYENSFGSEGAYSLVSNGSSLRLIAMEEDLPSGYRFLCNLQLIKKQESKVLDLRRQGGGLSPKEENNYNLFDIGSLAGRPYRRGNTLIVTLPERCRAYEKEILSEIKKHSLGEDLPILLYE